MPGQLTKLNLTCKNRDTISLNKCNELISRDIKSARGKTEKNNSVYKFTQSKTRKKLIKTETNQQLFVVDF